MQLPTAPPLRRAAAAALAATALWLWAPAAHAVPGDDSTPAQPAAGTDVTWSVAPADGRAGTGRPHFTYTLPQGTRITDAITVANRSDRSITLRIYASDAFTTPSGGLDLLPVGRTPTDVGSWITPLTGTLTLAPQQTREVPFTVTVPSGATPGDHTGGIVTSLVTGDGNDGVTLDRRLGSRVYLRVPGVLTPGVTVGKVHARYDGTADPAGTGGARVTYTVTNTGNVRLTGRQHLRVSGLFGAYSGGVELPGLPELLPGDSLTRTAVVRGVWPAGPLRATVSVGPVPALDGPPQPVTRAVPAAGSTTLWAWPWPQLALLALVAAVCAGLLRLRHRNRRKVAAAVEKAVGDALATAPRTSTGG